ncbi:MAG: CinA family protein [Bacilli bacterium]|nr:CinA family protein [Bacilli bacterium]
MKALKVIDKLIEKNWTISFAESCTGGLLAATFVEVPNASKVFNESFVTYSDESKIVRLGVNKETIEKHTVYSKEVADEMAINVAKTTNSNVGIGISGIAGPSGGTIDNPVGTVYISIVVNNKLYSYKEYYEKQTRNEVRNSTVEFVINKLDELI